MEVVNDTTFSTLKATQSRHNVPRSLVIGGGDPEIWVPNINLDLWDNEIFLNYNAPIQANPIDLVEVTSGPRS
jgi:hypothetical protein